MNEAVHTILGYSFYTTGLGLVVVFPFIVWFLFALMKYLSFFQHDKHNAKAKTIIIPSVFIMISFFAVFGDVIWFGIKATNTCKKAGVYKINKIVQADGFIGSTNIDYWYPHGFKYVEISSGRKKYRFEIVNNKKIKSKINNFKSIYRIDTSIDYSQRYIRKIKYSILKIDNNEILAEYNTIALKPGWFDCLFSGLWGNPCAPIKCCDAKFYTSSQCDSKYQLIKKVIKPKGEIK